MKHGVEYCIGISLSFLDREPPPRQLIL